MSSKKQLVVEALLDTIFPAGCPVENDLVATCGLDADVINHYMSMKATDRQGIALKIIEIIDTYLNADVRKQLNTVFWLLSSRVGTLVLGGKYAFVNPFYPTRFPDLPTSNKEAILISWSQSSLELFRKAFKGIKGILASTVFSYLDLDGSSPILEALNYPVTDPRRPPQPLSEAQTAENYVAAAHVDLSQMDGTQAGISKAAASLAAKGIPVRWEHDLASGTKFTLDCDAVIVGSGAGGGVAAAQLAAAGLKVLVLEKGPFTPAHAMTLQESEAFPAMMESAGFLTTENGATSVLAGTTLGGGTRINWNASFITPPHVRKEWSEQLGLKAFGTREFDEALDAVTQRTSVHTGFRHGAACAAFAAGLRDAGMDCGEVPRNCVDEDCGGHCCFGCARGAKQDSLNTFLGGACRDGAKVLTGIWADKVIKQNKKAMGVVAIAGSGTSLLHVAIAAPIVICSAGSLHTPGLLMRSGIKRNVGNNLRIHPCTCIVGSFTENKAMDASAQGAVVVPESEKKGGTIRCWEGPIMSIYSREVGNWEGSGYGALLYTPATHPGLFAAASPWVSGCDFKQVMLKYPNAVAVLVLVRDSGSGSVRVDENGYPRVNYVISDVDKAAMLKGMEAGLKALEAAGASEVMTIHNSLKSRCTFPHDASPQQRKQVLDTFIAEEVLPVGVPELHMPTFSAHQMGTARMGIDPSISVTNPNGECWECSGLYCCDGSVFPTPTGVNPMITIEAISYMLSKRLVASVLKESNGAERRRRERVEGLQYEVEAKL